MACQSRTRRSGRQSAASAPPRRDSSTIGFPVTGVLINGTTAPSASYTASRITSLVLTFNTAVTVETGAFSLSNGTFTLTNGGGGISVSGSGTSTLTLTFTGSSGVEFGSLADGIWTLTTDLTKVKNSNNVAGSGTTTTQNIRRLFGDVNGDGTVDGTDFADFGNAFGQSFGEPGFLAAVDFDANNTIDGTDFGEFGNRFGTTL